MMLNNVTIVGRLVEEPYLIEKEQKAIGIKIAVPRSYKNEEGTYETDIIPCIIWQGISNTITEYCHKGDLVGIRGRLQNNSDKIEIIAEKVTMLSSIKKEEK